MIKMSIVMNHLYLNTRLDLGDRVKVTENWWVIKLLTLWNQIWNIGKIIDYKGYGVQEYKDLLKLILYIIDNWFVSLHFRNWTKL